MASSCVIVLWHSPKLTAELPAWVYLYTAFALFAYQSLDAIDGKQARRTGMAGPLGELFDHGCDAVNLMLTGLVIPALFRVEPNLMCMSLMVLGIIIISVGIITLCRVFGILFGHLGGVSY
jgi:ethanolaminephosphotransferase